MNCITGKFKFGFIKDSGEIEAGDLFQNSAFEVKISRINAFDFSSQPYFYNRDSGVLCGITGYISNLPELKTKFGFEDNDDTKVIEFIYSQIGLEQLRLHLEGLFTVIIYDHHSQEGYIFQDENGSNLPLYYASLQHEAVFSNSLKGVLGKLDFKREFDLQGAYDFLFYRFLFNGNMIPNSRTLIKGISKLVPDKYLYFNQVGKNIEVKSFKRLPAGKNIKKHGLLDSIDASIHTLCGQLRDKSVYAALSSGFDTNYLAYKLRKQANVPIKVFTIGGKDKSEIPVARLISSYYGNLSHITNVLSEKAMDTFPDIVWKLEGYMFDISCFLQYELAQQLRRQKAGSFFVGDGADQILDFPFYTFQPRINRQIGFNFMAKLYYMYFKNKGFKGLGIFKPFFYLRRKASGRMSYYIMLDYILKDSGLMLNSSNIQGLYPFLGKDVKTAARSLGLLNIQKRFYKHQVRKALPEQVVKHLAKIGGDTDIEYIFNSKKEQIVNKVRGSSMVNSLLGKPLLDSIVSEIGTNMYLILLLLYLSVFEELFISGRYDASFDARDLKVSIDVFL